MPVRQIVFIFLCVLLFTGSLFAKKHRMQQLHFIVSCNGNGYLAKVKGENKTVMVKQPTAEAVWKFYRMGAGRCLVRNFYGQGKPFLTLDTKTGNLGFSEKKANGSYWMQINRGAKGKYFLKSLAKSDFKGQFICADSENAALEKDRKQKKCLWKMQKLKNYLYAYNVLKTNMGTRTFDLILFRGDQQIWAQEDVTIPMSKESSYVKVELPDYSYDKIRLELKEPYGKKLALSEVQVWEGFENVALGSKVEASEEYGKTYKGVDVSSANVVDKIIDTPKTKKKKGFWVIKNKKGWIELDMTQKLKDRVN